MQSFSFFVDSHNVRMIHYVITNIHPIGNFIVLFDAPFVKGKFLQCYSSA